METEGRLRGEGGETEGRWRVEMEGRDGGRDQRRAACVSLNAWDRATALGFDRVDSPEATGTGPPRQISYWRPSSATAQDGSARRKIAEPHGQVPQTDAWPKVVPFSVECNDVVSLETRCTGR